MLGLFDYFSNYYYLVIILQGFCVFHSIKNGNQNKWIWIIVFLPLIGSLVYLFTEVIRKKHVTAVQSGMTGILNPGGKIKQLEKKLVFSDTFANRVALADAYLDKKLYEQAVELYEGSLTGLFENNEHIIKQLIQGYYHLNRLEDILAIAPRVVNTLYFSKSKANLFYALALEKMGNIAAADKQYQNMNHRFSNYEARYHYGEFLTRTNRQEEAIKLFETIAEEARHTSNKEKGKEKQWIDKAMEQV